MEFGDDRREIVDLCTPGDWRGIIGPRTASSALIVENQLELIRKIEEVRKEVVVVRSGAAMEHQKAGRTLPAVAAPEERLRGGTRGT
jgi:hypothetical protein